MIPRGFRSGPGGRAVAALALAVALVPGPAAALDPDVPFRDYELDRWGVEHGLPQITVMSIVQDRAGYLWVGTQNGIARFDGLDFETYDRATTGKDTTMAVGGLVDGAGRVWFGTPRGALYIERDRIHEVRAADDLLSVRAVAETTDGRLLFATERGIYTLGDDTLMPLWTVGTPVFSLHVEGDALWAGGVGRLSRVASERPDEFQLPRLDARVTHIARRGDELWLGTDHGPYAFDPARRRFTAIVPELAGRPIESLAVDRDGNAWIGTAEQLLRITPKGRTETIGTEDLAGRPWVLAIYEDAEGDLWLGTRRESLYRVHNSPTVVRSERDGLGDPFVWSVLADGDGLLVGTNSNLMRFDADGRFHELVPGRRLPNPSVYDLARDPDGAVWVGTRGGLARYAGGRLEVPPALAPLGGQQITGVHRVGESDWWIATMDGLFRYRDGALDTVIAPAGSANTRIRCLLPLSPNELLVGTEAGVRRVHGRDVEPVPWGDALEGSFIARIAEVKPGLLAITTLDSGLGLVAEDRLLVLGTEHGLPTRNGWTLDVVGEHLYVGSIVGVYRIPLAALPDPRAAAPEHVDSQVVAESTGRVRTLKRFACCNGGAAARSVQVGPYLYYPTTNGVARLDTGAIPRVPPPPRALIEALRNSGATWRFDGPIALDAASRDVAIEFTGLSLIDSHAIEFRYRLHGYDEDWVDAGNRRMAYYTHLPPGDYTFVVEARHPLGGWSESSQPLAFEIVPEWYERVGVQILAALLALAALTFAWRRRVAELRARQRELEQAVAEQTHELARANERLRGANRALALENQTDPLTGLRNRRFVMASRYAGSGARAADRCALLLMDLDEFKEVNDRHGHASGDAVLVELAHVLTDAMRLDDLVTRWGGEEFLILLPGADEAQALVLAERLRRAVAGHRFRAADGSPLGLTCSVGVALCPPHASMADAPLCGAAVDADKVKDYGKRGKIGQQLMAVAGLVEGERGRVYLPVEAVEMPSEATLGKRLGAFDDDWPGPAKLSLAPEYTGGSCVPYALDEFWKLFTNRQAIALLTFSRVIHESHARIAAEVHDRNLASGVVTYLALAMDKLADNSNVLCRWEASDQIIKAALSRQALPMVWDFAEIVPYEKLSGSFEMNLAAQIEAIRGLASVPGTTTCTRVSATDLPLGDGVIDAVVTDPPYYDNISYADLSDFFYVWLKRTLGSVYSDDLSSDQTPKRQEATVVPYRHSGDDAKARAHYESLMAASLSEAGRVLRPGGPVVVVYAHKTVAGWSTLVNALRRASCTVTEAWPLRTESDARLNARDTAALATSIFLVARKQTHASTCDDYEDALLSEVGALIDERVRGLWRAGLTGADLVIAVIGAALGPFTRHNMVRRANGAEVRTAEFLEDAQRMAMDAILKQVVRDAAGKEVSVAGIDPISRLYVVGRMQFQEAAADFDTFKNLAIGALPPGTELDGMRGALTSGAGALLSKKGSKVSLRSFEERGKDRDLGLSVDGKAPALIDVLHRLLWLQKSRPADIPKFLKESQADLDAVRLLAQALGGRPLRAEPRPGAQKDERTAEQRAIDTLLASLPDLLRGRSAGPLFDRA